MMKLKENFLIESCEHLHGRAGSGIEFGNDTESLGKSADNWLSTFGEESISALTGPFCLMHFHP